MFSFKRRKSLSFILVVCIILTSEFKVLAAVPKCYNIEPETIEYEELTNYENFTSPLTSIWEQIPELASIAVETQEWYQKALVNTDSQINVYAESSEDSSVLAFAYNNTLVNIDEFGETWNKISSGDIVGYIKNDCLLTGTNAVERMSQITQEELTNVKTVEEVQKEQEAIKQQQEIEKLLAALIYCEAGNQSYEGKVGVGAVVMNRVKSTRFPNTIKEVIYQPGQFTPALNGKLERVILSNNIPQSCYDAARASLNGETTVGDALFFNGSYGNFKLGDHYFS